MGKKLEQQQPQQKDQTPTPAEQKRVEAVLDLVRKQAPLTMKQERFCNNGCVERFVRAKSDNVKKAAKSLRACLSWRETIGIENLMADEFSSELAEGVAYVAGHDEESRPVLIFRIKQDYQKYNSQKLLTRLLVFTLEVAIRTMPRNTEHLVLLFDATVLIRNRTGAAMSEIRQRSAIFLRQCPECPLSVLLVVHFSWGCYRELTHRCFFRSASAFMNLFLATLKILGEYYPGRLYKAFVIDPPSLFSYLWKGVRPFVELSTVTVVVSSLDFEEPLEFNDFSSYPSRASSLRFDHSSIKSAAKIGSCSSSRFSFTVSHHFDSLKPWYLTLTNDTSASSKVGPTGGPSPLGPALISPLNARSYSFASPASRSSSRGSSINGGIMSSRPTKKSLFPSTPLPQRVTEPVKTTQPRTPRPSFLQSPALFFKRECHVSKADRSRETFVPFLKFYRRPYDEMIYRSKMRPPLGGLISIVSPHIRRRHMSVSQRF